MTEVRTFKGSLVNPAKAHEVVAPAYDSMTAEQRECYADARPGNYLNVMRTQEDYSQDISVEDILRNNKENLERMIADGSFCKQSQRAFVIYRLIFGDHQQTGLVAEIPVQEVDDGRVRKHESTRRDREELLVQYQAHVGVSSSPVALAYPANPKISQLLNRIADEGSPYLDFVSEDGLRQVLWRVEDSKELDAIAALFETVDTTYLTDGHHRVAAASRYREMHRGEPETDDLASRDDLLVALFPDEELTILPFHRVVKDLNGLSQDEFLQKLRKNFIVDPIECSPDDPIQPESIHGFTMVLGEDSYRLTIKNVQSVPANPVSSLDVSLLQDLILEPILGIQDSRGDARLEYVSGTTGCDAVNGLRRRGWQIAFYCYPISMQEIMDVSDANQVMPPKSTCFEPKVRSGLFLLQK